MYTGRTSSYMRVGMYSNPVALLVRLAGQTFRSHSASKFLKKKTAFCWKVLPWITQAMVIDKTIDDQNWKPDVNDSMIQWFQCGRQYGWLLTGSCGEHEERAAIFQAFKKCLLCSRWMPPDRLFAKFLSTLTSVLGNTFWRRKKAAVQWTTWIFPIKRFY